MAEQSIRLLMTGSNKNPPVGGFFMGTLVVVFVRDVCGLYE